MRRCKQFSRTLSLRVSAASAVVADDNLSREEIVDALRKDRRL